MNRLRHVEGPVSATETSPIFGPALLQPSGIGIDLADYGYLEEEFVISGEADLYGSGDDGETVLRASGTPFATRVVVRRPIDPARFSGSVQLEPLHMEIDWAPTWQNAAQYILREGHAFVGVTTFEYPLATLAKFDPFRYGSLDIPDEGYGYDIIAQVGVALRDGDPKLLGGLQPKRLTMSGWSATGSFIRTFILDGFHERARLADGTHAFTGFLIVIAGAGDVKLGYWPLHRGAAIPAVGPRRVIRDAGVPVIELLTEYEAESNASVNREDSDAPSDPYRMYQVAGMSHVNASVGEDRFTQKIQIEASGGQPQLRELVELDTDARFDVVMTAVLHRLERWTRDGVLPPRADRLTVLEDRGAGVSSVWPEAYPLERDSDGNAIGGVRTHWVDVPTARYVPHSSPKPGRFMLPPGIPLPGPEYFTDIMAHRVLFPREKLENRYRTWAGYRDLAIGRIDELVGEGWLLEPEAELLRRELLERNDWEFPVPKTS